MGKESEVEHSSFSPLVLSATGGMANEATTFYKRLASCLAMKRDYSYSTMSWLRCRLTFSSAQPSNASGVPCLAVAMLPSHHPPLTWPSLNFNVSDSLELISYSVLCTVILLSLYFYTTFSDPYMSPLPCYTLSTIVAARFSYEAPL